MKIYLAITYEDLRQAVIRKTPLVHMDYAIDSVGYLMHSGLPAEIQGGLMGISAELNSDFSRTSMLVRGIMRECTVRRYSGVFADFVCPSTAVSRAFLSSLQKNLATAGKALYVPEAHALAGCITLIGTAISGGTLRERLCSAVSGCSRSCLALDCERIMMDFPVPCRSGVGKALTVQQLQTLADRYGSPSFYSRELCANYFTYVDCGQLHFVQFDTAQTLLCKQNLGQELGIQTAFFMYPEVCDLIGALFPTV